MQSYKRKITYFYQFHNGNIGTTAGFLKLEIRGDKVKIIINIQEPPGLPFKEASLYFYHEAGDHLAALKVDKIDSISGMLTYQNRTDWQQIFDTGRDLYTFDGVAVVYNDSHYFIGDFKDKDRKDYALVRKDTRATGNNVQPGGYVDIQPVVNRVLKKERRQETAEIAQEIVINERREEREAQNAGMAEQQDVRKEMKQEEQKGEESEKTSAPKEMQPRVEEQSRETVEKPKLFPETGLNEERVEKERSGSDLGEAKKDVYEKCDNCPYHKRHMEQKENIDAFEKMIKEYPKLPMYGATELFDCIRIHPKDIGKLDMRNWKLGVNSFLTHGFYTYQYLLLGKMRFDNGSERPIIGVPGVYSNREKYLANMFGFEQFIPVKKTGVKTGEFGYWIVEISPYL